MRDHTRRRLWHRFLRRTELWSSKNVGIMTRPPQTVTVYGGTENVPKKKNSSIMFHLIPDGCKIVFNLENKNVFLIDCLNKMAYFGEKQYS